MSTTTTERPDIAGDVDVELLEKVMHEKSVPCDDPRCETEADWRFLHGPGCEWFVCTKHRQEADVFLARFGRYALFGCSQCRRGFPVPIPWHAI